MKNTLRKTLSLFLAFTLLCSLGLTAAASEAMGEDLTSKGTLLNQKTQLSTNVFWSTAYSDLRTENVVTYEPNADVTPIVTFGDSLTTRTTVTSAARALESQGYRVAAGINGDFFNTSNGLPIGILVSEGEVLSSDGGYYATEAAAQESCNYDSAAGAVDSSLVPENVAEAATDETAQKIIYNASLSMESTDFDATRETLLAAVEANNAWMESTSVYGTEKDHDRSADYTVRVPVDNYRAFLAAAGEAGSVRNVSENAQNITSSYIDVESRLAALEAQRTRLNELADQAETTADLLEIESQLSDVQYQLENYTRQLRNMDQQVSYSTVDIYLEEVATLTPTGVTFTERIADAFGGGWDAFVGFVQGLVIALVYLWPVVLIVIAVIAALRFWRKRHPKAPKAPKPIQTPPPAEYAVKSDNEPKPKY